MANQILIKVCTKCGLNQPISNFNKQSECRGGRNSRCKSCISEYKKKWKIVNKEAVRLKGAKYYQENRARLCKLGRIAKLKRDYGLTEEEFNKMKVQQNNACAICGNKAKGKNLDIDHCHKSGRVRQLLCNCCNTGLGYFKDNSLLLVAASQYIEHHAQKIKS